VSLAQKGEGEWVANPAPMLFTGWVSRKADSKPDVWVKDLAPGSIVKLEAPRSSNARPLFGVSANGWPEGPLWTGMRQPLFSTGLADLLVATLQPPRRSSAMRPEQVVRTPATYGSAKAEETPYTLVFTQPIFHPHLVSGTRRLELWRDEPRARVTVTLDRASANTPTILYVAFPFPTGKELPRLSNGGVEFTPYTDQLEGSCRDYYAIDGYAHYKTQSGDWLWVTVDAPMMTVGGPHTWRRRTTVPDDPNRLWAQVFDNFWHTNFVADQHGLMEFRFELAWRQSIPNPAALAETLAAEPVLVANGPNPISPELMERLFRP
jgi:hypothetical protein